MQRQPVVSRRHCSSMVAIIYNRTYSYNNNYDRPTDNRQNAITLRPILRDTIQLHIVRKRFVFDAQKHQQPTDLNATVN
jgi:hypothetical protein